ncbi:MAG: hypothetical protein KUG78_16875 [Kangiellaceae bacterium]|nr:hypothetical protein [Kangiellaceae bacterium]
MSKGINQKSWLNIVIIVVSGLILAFTLLGRFMDRSTLPTDRPTQVGQEKGYQIARLDFGAFRLIKKNSIWRFIPADNLNQQLAEETVIAWQELLDSSAEDISKQSGHSWEPLATVLIYLTEIDTPLIVKIDRTQEYTMLTFLSSGREIILDSVEVERLLPDFLLVKPNLDASD